MWLIFEAAQYVILGRLQPWGKRLVQSAVQNWSANPFIDFLPTTLLGLRWQRPYVHQRVHDPTGSHNRHGPVYGEPQENKTTFNSQLHDLKGGTLGDRNQKNWLNIGPSNGGLICGPNSHPLLIFPDRLGVALNHGHRGGEGQGRFCKGERKSLYSSF